MHQTYDNQVEHSAFIAGIEHAQRFQCGPHLLTQTIFRAETPDHKVLITYDDVEGLNYLTVTFKRRRDADGNVRTVELHYNTSIVAYSRALRFLSAHVVPEAYCDVDY